MRRHIGHLFELLFHVSLLVGSLNRGVGISVQHLLPGIAVREHANYPINQQEHPEYLGYVPHERPDEGQFSLGRHYFQAQQLLSWSPAHNQFEDDEIQEHQKSRKEPSDESCWGENPEKDADQEGDYTYYYPIDDESDYSPKPMVLQCLIATYNIEACGHAHLHP
jgi:hypothetical protein